MNKFLLIPITLLFFFSCSKNSNPTPATATIVGKWNITADTSQTVGYAPYIIVGINSPYMQFNTDGSGTEKYNIGLPDVVLNFTYTLTNNSLTVNYPVQTQYPNGYSVTGTIKKLTSSNLVIGYDITNQNLTVKEVLYLSR